MDDISKLLNNWLDKLLAGALIASLSDIGVSIAALTIMMVIDTVSGVFYALKLKKYSHKKLKRFLEKMVTYFAAIIAMRLVEAGISPLVKTSLATSVLSGFLIITEGISVLRNLTLLGVPLPSGFARMVMKFLKVEPIDVMLNSSQKTQNYIAEVTDMIDYQIPGIQSKEMQEILRVKFGEWSHVIINVDQQLSENAIDDKELIFYKMTSLFNTTWEIINEKLKDSDVCAECIENFNKWHNPRIEKWMKGIKEICFSDDSLEKKKYRIMEKIIIILYETIIDIQKGEAKLFNDNCR